MRLTHLKIFGLLAALALLVYAPCLGGPFVWDDHVLVETHQVVSGRAAWTEAFWGEMYAGTQTNYYRPLTLLSFRLQASYDGLADPIFFHLFNVLLHAAIGFLVFCFLRRYTGDQFVGFFTALLFILHPIHNESVAYISGRADLLAAFFVLGALLFFSASGSERRGFKVGFYIAGLSCFVAALLSKETAIVFPFALWILRRLGPAPRVLAGAPLGPVVAVACAYLFLRLGALDFSLLAFPWDKKAIALASAGPIFRMEMFLKSLALYAGDLVFPFDLHMVRWALYENIGTRHIAALVALVVGSLALARRRIVALKILLLPAAFWFLVWFLPQSPFVFPYIRADHFLYLASVGFFWFLAALGRHHASRRWVLLALSVYFGVSAFIHAGFWRDEHRFFERLHRFAPWSADVADRLAESYLRRGASSEALLVYLRPIDHRLREIPADFCAWCDQAVLAESLGFQDRRFLGARLFYNAGVLLEGLGRQDEALCAYRSAHSCDGDFVKPVENSGLILWQRGDVEGATRSLRKAVQTDPAFVAGWNNLAALMASQGRMEEAEAYLSQALRRNPGYIPALRNKNAWKSPKND